MTAQGIPVSEIGYGAWGIGQKQWLGGNDADSLLALRRAFRRRNTDTRSL